MGHPHWVVQVPRLRYCTNAYGYTYSNSYVYAYCHCDVHTDCDCNIYAYGYSDLYADSYRYSYSDANTDASCADGIECYQHNCQWLYCELDQCGRCDRLSLRRFYQQHVWYSCATL